MADRIELKFLRGDKGSEPYALPANRQAYLLDRPDGSLGTAELDWDAELLNDMALLYRGERDRPAAQRIGDRLAKLLRQMDWSAARARLTEGMNSGKRVEIIIRSHAAELYALPWELATLDESGQALGELGKLLVRYELPDAKPSVASPTDPELGRILYAWSAAGGAVPHEAHGQAIAEAASAGGHSFDPAADTVQNASVARLVEAMRANPPAVLHLLCHGGMVNGVFGLVLDGPGGGEVVDPGTLRQSLEPFLPTLRLVVLSACHGGHSGPAGNHLGSAAQALHRLGIPAVVSSRFPLSVAGSIDLARVLWQRLLVDLDSLEDAFLAARTRLEDRTTTLDWASVQLWCHRLEAPDLRPIAFRPYRGLMPFRKEDYRFFFGRERETAELVKRVREDAEGERGITVVAGASGSGKSSVVQGGLIPQLMGTPGERWQVVLMRPGTGSPMATLTRELGEEGANDVPALAQRLLEAPEARLLVLVDQFEEVFTDSTAWSESATFMKTLWALANAKNCAVLLSMRVDFFARCGELMLHDDVSMLRLVYDGRYRVFIGPMDAESLSATIRRPPERVGLVLEQGLAEALLQQVRDQMGALPLLEYALEMLWAKRDGHVLRHSTFEELGGVVGALTQTADAFVEGLSPEVLRQVHRLFIELIEIGSEHSFATRRRVFMDRIRPTKAEDLAAFEQALEGLVKLHLVVVGEEPTTPPQRWIDLAHEALIHRWKRLQTWLEQDRERALAVRKVRGWTRDLAEDPNAVLDGNRLGYALNVREENPDSFAAEDIALIERSVQALQRKRLTAQRRVLGLIGAALVSALIMGVLGLRANNLRGKADKAQAAAVVEQEKAKREALRARNATRLSVARSLRDRAPTRSLVLLRDVERDSEDALKVLDEAHWPEETIILLQRPFSRAVYTGHMQSVTDAEYSEDGKYVLTVSQDGTARVWGADNDVPPLILEHGTPLRRTMYIDATHVATGGALGGVWYWTLGPDGPQKRELTQHGGEITDIDSKGAWILSASLDGIVRRWSDIDATPVDLKHPAGVRSVDTSSDGTRLATACDDGNVYIWSVADPSKPPLRLAGHKGRALDVDFSGDGDELVSAGEDGTARVWDGRTGRYLRTLQGDSEALVGAEWSPTDDRILTWSTDGNVRIYAPGQVKPAVVLDDLSGAISEAAWSHDGTRVLAGSASGEAAVWDADDEGAPMMLPGHTDRITSAAFALDDSRVLTSSNDGDVRSWSAHLDPDFTPLRSSPSNILALDVSHEGKIATANANGTILIYNDQGDGPIESLTLTRESAVTIVTWDESGTRLAASSDDGKIYVVYPSNAGRRVVLDGGRQPMTNVSWHPADPTRLVSTCEDGRIFLWDLDTPNSPVTVPLANTKLWAAEYTPEGAELIVATDDGNLYRLPSDGRHVASALGAPRTTTLYVIAVHPEGKEVAFSSQDGGVWVRSLENPNAEDRRVGQHEGPAFDLRYSADGTHLLSASYDGTVGLWDTEAGTGGVLRGHSSAVQSVGFLPDGKRFASGSADGTAILWSVDLFSLTTEQVLSEIEQASTACLSEQQYGSLLRLSAADAKREWTCCECAMQRQSAETCAASCAPMPAPVEQLSQEKPGAIRAGSDDGR